MAEKCNINLGEINERIETLVVTHSFMGGTTDLLIEDITKELKNISDEYALSNITEVVDIIYSALLDLGAVDLNPTFFTSTNIRNILEGAKLGVLPNTLSLARAEYASFQEAEQMLLRQNVTSEFLDNAYGMVTEAKKLAMDIANQNIFDALFINRGSIKIEGLSAGIVASNLELNRNIRIYQQLLLNKIVEFLNSVIKPSMSLSLEVREALADPTLYRDGEVTQVLTNLRPLINSYLSRDVFKSPSDVTGTTLDGLRSLYKIANDPSDSKYEESRLRLDAYNANVILLNFDSYLDVVLGNTIEIQDFGKKTGRDNKYAVGKKTAKLLTTWSNSEERDVESEADFITKLAINTTPLYNWLGERPIPGKFLTFADYLYIIGKIKDLAWNENAINHVMVKPARYGNRLDTPVYWNSLSEKTQNIITSVARNSDGTIREVRFSSLINMIRRNPRRYLGAIFELLSNLNFLNTVGFNSKTFADGDKKVIYSLAKGVFSPLEGNSLYNLSKLDAETDYYSFITLVADTIFNVGYVLYYRDEEGVLLARTFVSQNINNLRRSIEATINAANSTRTIKDISIYENRLLLEENSENQITFTIPNTDITATVHTSGSTVVFTNKDGQVITNFESLLLNSNILQFLDSKLRLNINDNIDLLNALVEAFEGKSKLMQDLLSFASRVVLNQHITSKYIDPIQDITEKEVKLKEIFGNNAPKYDKLLEVVNSISGADINTLRTIAVAKANVAGITTATLTKDGAGNGQSMQTQSRLLGSQWSQFELQEKQAWSATKDCLILNVPGLYEGVYTAKEYYDGMESKSFVDMCVSEFSYASFVNDYIGGLVINLSENQNSLVGDGHVMFLPSVNSDKGTIGRIKINLNKPTLAPDGTTKPIREFNHSELRWLIAKLFGTIYTRMYESVLNDWNTLYNFATNIKQLSIPTFDYLSNFEAFNQWWLLNSHIETIKGKEIRIGNTFREKNPAEFIKALTLEYNQSHRLNPLTLIDLTHFLSKEQTINVDGELIKIKGSLSSNLVLISQIARYNPTYLNDRGIDASLYPDEKTFWDTKHKEILKSLIKSRFEINTTGNKLKLKELEYLRNKYPTWINESGNVVLAKVDWNGRIINITSARDLIRFAQSDGQSSNDIIDKIISSDLLTLHPAIETWNYLDYLFTQEFMDCTVGSFINHPEKSKGKSREDIIREAEFKKANGFTEGTDPRPALYKRVLEQEAAHFLAQHKRNVSFTASMHEFLLNLLKGIPEIYNLAVIDDIHDEQGTIMGLLNDIKPFDGATFVNPFVVLLENFALGGARAGISKKLFVHFKNEHTGGGGIIKTAGFGLTNDWIRNSPFLLRMMQKMTDHVWLNEDGSPAIVNITKDYKGNTVTLKNRYFELNGRVFEIVRVESLGNNLYRRIILEIEVDEYKRPLVNSHIGPEIIESPKTINTNYLLWQFFGGDRSMSVDNSGKYLEYSNSSVENVVEIMNRCAGEDVNGNIITKNGTSVNEVETLDDLWQPLKLIDVHYLATAGAVKLGAANINSNSKYHDNVAYDTQRIKMYQAGIQLDKEHHADDAELSLMTLVISACAAKGYTFEAASKLYDALRKSTEIGIKEHLNAVKSFITSDDATGIQEAMYEAIIHSLGTSKTNLNNFAYLVASDLIRQAREGKKIKFSEASLPLSDKTIYSKIFSTIASYLTNAGIKQKIPGILSVLTPSHNIFKIYAGKKLEAYTNPREDLAVEQAKLDTTPVFDINNPNTNISNIELGRTYKVTREVLVEIEDVDGNIVLTTVPQVFWELINTPTDYLNLKRDIVSGQITNVTEAVINENGDPLGRDLAAYNVRFTTINGESFLLWDLDSALALYRINEINDSKKLSPEEKVLKLLEVSLSIFPGQTIDTDKLETLVRRMLLKDLANLSQTTPDVIPLYEELLNSQATFLPTPTLELISYQWAVNAPNAYEVSSAGDNRFSALFARFAKDTQFMGLDISNMTIEDVYLKVIKKSGKGLPPAQDSILYNPNLTTKSAREDFSYNTAYLPLWQLWAGLNPTLIEELRQAVKGKTLTDKFAPNTTVTLARALADILTLTEPIQESIADPLSWYDRYAQWVNIYLGTGNGSELILPTFSGRVTAYNFATVEPLVKQAIINSTKVRIGKNLKTIDKSSIKVLAYELIMPKTFATNFGLKQFDSLSEIESNPNWFVELYRRNSEVQVEGNSYSIALKTSTGNHTYLLSRALLDSISSKYHKVDRDNIGLMSVDGKTVRLDSKGNILYEVSDDFELYVDDKGTEIIVTNDLTFYINNTSFESIQISERLLERPQVFRTVLDNINKSKNKIAKRFYNYITFGKEANINNIFNNHIEYNRIPNEGEVDYLTNPLIKALLEKHTSFVKALDVVAARIPSQSMQSFMPMRVIAFDNPDINTAYVSTMQILLQGSDYDVDAVSIATYDIDRNGRLLLWSPYANIETSELLEASLKLPIPTGNPLNFKESRTYLPEALFIAKYRHLFNITRARGRDWMPSETDVELSLKDNMSVLDILDLGLFLLEVLSLTIPAKRYYESFAKELNDISFMDGTITANHVTSFFIKLKELVDNHNLYFESLSSYTLSKVVNNSTMNGTYNVSKDPVNLMLAHTSVDATTGPLKKKANTSSEASEANTRTPGNVINKFEGIAENQTGKKGISICATGLKSYFGLTLYCNWVLNHGTTEELRRLLLGNDHQGITIGLGNRRKTYNSLANIRALDLNTVKNSELFLALSKTTLDEDIALTLSALLSLATDNAKELALSKLNAGTKMLGMYVYGLSIGMKFNDIADILMSPVGNVIKNMLDDDKFSGREAFGTVSEGLFKYFTDGPFRQLLRFDIDNDSKGNRLKKSPMDALLINLANEANLKDRNGKPLKLTDMLVEISKSPWTLVEKIKILEKLRRKYAGRIEGSIETSKEAVEVYNQLIDFVEDYVQQSDIIWKHEGTFLDIAKLSAGALEMKTLGLVLSLNQGIKTTSGDFLTQINNLRRAIYNKTNNLEDIVDLTKFAFDENPYTANGREYSSYRLYIIERYEGIKEAFNIFDVVTKVPHFMGYLLALVTTNVEINNAFTFRSADNLLLPVKEKLGQYIKEDRLTVGILNYCSDWLLKHWMLDTGKQIIIPAGNLAFDRNGNLYTLTEDTTIWLGTDWGNATFRLWMENEVIPNLKEGIIIPGKQWTKISNNKFIKDLGNNLLNKTISRNTTVVLTLPINMLPSTDAERSAFNQYKSQFNELTDGYLYELTSYITNPDGKIVELKTLSEPISITDLFIYYAMIANSWKLDLISLVPITEDFQNRGIIEEFHNYVAGIDKSGFILSLDNILWEEFLPYVAPSDSPYSSSAEVIWARNPKTLKRVLMDKLSKEELRLIRESGTRPSNVFNKYQAREAIDNLNFFSTGQIGKESKITLDITLGDLLVKVSIRYSTDTNLVQKLDIPNLDILLATDPTLAERLKWIEEIPMMKLGMAMIPNVSLLKMLLNHALNPCG